MLAARIKARIHRKEQIGEEKEKVAVWLPIFSVGKLNVLKCGRQRVDLADSTRCDCDVDERLSQAGKTEGQKMRRKPT
jgi:hypothetical protein